MRKLLLVLLAVIVLGSTGLFVWARSVLAQDTVRAALATQLASALGQPVSIGTISATIYPRVTVTLGNVAIGSPAGIEIAALDVGTDFRALLSRRIEHATAHVQRATIHLPLIPLGRASGGPPSGSTERSGDGPPVQLVSVDEIVLSEIALVSGGRTVRGDAEVVPESDGAFTLRRLTLVADDARIEATGRITDASGPVGVLSINAGELNLDRLFVFLDQFARGATSNASATAREGGATSGAEPNLDIAVTSTRATLAGMSLGGLEGRAKVTERGVTLQPLTFDLFGGKYDGALAFSTTPGGEPAFTVQGTLARIDLPSVTRFAGATSEPITGRLSAQLDLSGSGGDIAAALRSMRGVARVTLHDGIVRNLGLVRAVVVATSMRGTAATVEGAGAAASQEAATSRDEPFKVVRATLAIAGASATTDDLQFEGTNLTSTTAGSIALNGSAVNLAGRVQLSEELSARAGTDLYRLTRENGRVTLPITVSGPATALAVKVDVGRVLQRAVVNRAEEELKKARDKLLGGFLRKRK